MPKTRERDGVDEKAERRRLDKWLFFARFTKTRSLAAQLIVAGHVRVNGKRVENAAKGIVVGDVLTVAAAHGTLLVRVVQLGERRGPASEARLLYALIGDGPSDAGDAGAEA